MDGLFNENIFLFVIKIALIRSSALPKFQVSIFNLHRVINDFVSLLVPAKFKRLKNEPRDRKQFFQEVLIDRS